jgi:hypothetical protein
MGGGNEDDEVKRFHHNLETIKKRGGDAESIRAFLMSFIAENKDHHTNDAVSWIQQSTGQLSASIKSMWDTEAQRQNPDHPQTIAQLELESRLRVQTGELIWSFLNLVRGFGAKSNVSQSGSSVTLRLDDVTEDQAKAVRDVVSWTGCSEQTALKLLVSTFWNVERAVHLHFDNNEQGPELSSTNIADANASTKGTSSLDRPQAAGDGIAGPSGTYRKPQLSEAEEEEALLADRSRLERLRRSQEKEDKEVARRLQDEEIQHHTSSNIDVQLEVSRKWDAIRTAQANLQQMQEAGLDNNDTGYVRRPMSELCTRQMLTSNLHSLAGSRTAYRRTNERCRRYDRPRRGRGAC